MNEKPVTKELARRFLLGAVDDSERQQIESLFLIDSETNEKILIAEDELLEDYLEGNLSESDSAKFLQQFAPGPRQQRKLRIAASIREHALTQVGRDRAFPSTVQKLRGLNSWPLIRERRFHIPIAVTLMVLVVAAIWLVLWNNQRQREQNLRLTLEREFAELNSPSSLNNMPPQMMTVVLPPVSLRSVQSAPDVSSQSAHRTIELRLLWTQKQESPGYKAVIRRVGGIEEFTIDNLRSEENAAGKFVRLRLPVHSMPRGHYGISLSGIPDGPTEQYDFVIAD